MSAPPNNPPTGKAAPNWELIELDYRAGIKTLRQIADENGITHGAITKRARRDEWERDLSEKIQAKADALVSKALVSNLVSKESRVSEKQLVDANARAIADVRLSHRTDIHRARNVSNALLCELEQQTDPETLAMLRELGVLMRAEDDKGVDKRNDLYKAILSLSERSKTMKTLADSLRVVIDMERTAFGMDKDPGQAVDALSRVLTTIASGVNSAFTPVAIDPERAVGLPFVAYPDDRDD